jgi:hypothetical protein
LFKTMIRILYVDDEEALLDVCKRFLEDSGDMAAIHPPRPLMRWG